MATAFFPVKSSPVLEGERGNIKKRPMGLFLFFYTTGDAYGGTSGQMNL